jgi:hypothetical protein
MSCVVVLVPVVISAWPVLAASIVAASAAAGFKVVKEPATGARSIERVELELEGSEVVADSMRADEQMVIERAGVRVVFSRDARGQFKTCVEGRLPKAELKAIGEDLSGRVIQEYVYRRLSEELGASGFTTVAESRGEDESIRLHVRRFEG